MIRWMIKVVLGSALTLAVGVSPAAAQHGHGEHGHGGKKTALAALKCPVMGEPINFALSVAEKDGPVFFCCKGCISKYKRNPSKYAAKFAAQRKALAGRDKVQVTCPITGEPVDQKVAVESDGRKVYFCCKNCVGKYQSNPSKYRTALANSYTYQTKCPVMDEEINPKVFAASADGRKIYFCCKGCDKKLFANPAKYAPKLAAQGFTVSATDLKQWKQREHGKKHGHGPHDHHAGHEHGDGG